MAKDSYGKKGDMGKGMQSSVIMPGTGGSDRPTSLKGGGKMSIPVSNEGMGEMEMCRKGNVKALE